MFSLMSFRRKLAAIPCGGAPVQVSPHFCKSVRWRLWMSFRQHQHCPVVEMIQNVKRKFLRRWTVAPNNMRPNSSSHTLGLPPSRKQYGTGEEHSVPGNGLFCVLVLSNVLLRGCRYDGFSAAELVWLFLTPSGFFPVRLMAASIRVARSTVFDVRASSTLDRNSLMNVLFCFFLSFPKDNYIKMRL